MINEMSYSSFDRLRTNGTILKQLKEIPRRIFLVIGKYSVGMT